MNKATVFLVPNLLGDNTSLDKSLPSENKVILESLSHFAVENIKDARRFLVKLGLKHKIDESSFYILDKKSRIDELAELTQALNSGESVGIISDAGCPGIADPGALLVNWAHKNKIKVVPLIGPSSILLALIASGFSGQSFCFHGYLDREKSIRQKQLRKLESDSRNLRQTQIFMETPYRNDALIEDAIAVLSPNTQLCIAANISLDNEYIRSKSQAQWKEEKTPSFHKQAAIFLISA